MDKRYLRELFTLQANYLQLIANIDEKLKQPTPALQGPFSYVDLLKAEKQILQKAETDIDALINFYMTYHK